jgi:hypothetical protein
MYSDRVKNVLARIRPWLPWLSLATGIVGAILMNRTPGRAWVVIAASILGWAVLVVVNVLGLVDKDAAKTVKQRAGRFALITTNQIAIQQALLFPLPFYVRAASLHVGHAIFLAIYAAVLVVVLWDPLFHAVFRKLPLSIAIIAFSVFVALCMGLPIFGLSSRYALLIAAGAAGVGGPLLLVMRNTGAKARAIAIVSVPLLIGLAYVGAPVVPPAPLELVKAGIGTQIENREIVDAAKEFTNPAELVCHTAIKAPLGLKDALFHVWSKDGVRSEPIALDVKGGREQGFRTWSRKKGPITAGKYTCSIETASRQVLGSVRVTVH